MPNTKSQQTSLKILMKTVNPIPLDFASLTSAKNETLDIMKQGIEVHINDWCIKKGNLTYGPEDFQVNNSNFLYYKLYPERSLLLE